MRAAYSTKKVRRDEPRAPAVSPHCAGPLTRAVCFARMSYAQIPKLRFTIPDGSLKPLPLIQKVYKAVHRHT